MVKGMQQEGNIMIALPFTGEEEWQALKEPLTSGWLTQGPQVAAFEEAFAKRHGTKYALATTSCTTALHLALLAVGVQPGDRVIVPSYTWVATANAVEYCGGVPVFCDSNPETYNLDLASVRSKIRECIAGGIYPKAIVAVHLFGLCAEMDAILEIAQEYNIKVIEDAACAVGAAYKDKSAGSIGDVGCFSFHPRKIITTGEGGMCTTNKAEIAEAINCLRNHGASISEEQRHNSNRPFLMPDFNVLGFNYRMTDLQGAVGRVQLGRLDQLIAERRQWAEYYRRELADIDWLITPVIPQKCQHSWQAFVCRVDEDKAPLKCVEIMDYLHRKGISTRPGTHAVHLLGFYSHKYGLKSDDYPTASMLYKTTLALPLHNRMTANDYQRVVTALKEI